MPQYTTGRAAFVANHLPTSKTVTTASNATPIVVTTSAAHLLQTNEVVAISGVSGNSAANGVFVVSVLSTTTVSLLAYPAGTNVAGTGAGTGGTLISLGFGMVVPIPVDLTDAERAASVNVALEALLDRTAWLAYQAGYNLPNTKVDRAGDTMTGALTVSTGTSNSITTTGNIFSGGDVGLGNSEEILSVTNATNATPIVITTAAHSLPDGAQVIIASVGGNTAANGTWVAHVLSGTTFSLIGSSGNGAYTTGGTMTRRAQVTFGASRTVTRTLTAKWDSSASQTSGNRFWIETAAGPILDGWQNVQSDPTTQQMWIGWDIEIPQGAHITSATMYFQPPSGHGGVPSQLPTVTVGKVSLATGASSSLASATDPNSGSVPAYEVYTALTATLGTAEYVDRAAYRYYVYLATETSTNALQGMRVVGASVTYVSTGADQF